MEYPLHFVQWQWQSSCPYFRVLCNPALSSTITISLHGYGADGLSEGTPYKGEVTCQECLARMKRP